MRDFLLNTPRVRVLARKVFHTYERTLPDGNRVLLRSRDANDRSVLEEVYERNVYEKHFPIEKGFTVIDAGAHIGLFTMKAAKLVGRPDGRVLAVEPSSENFEMLKRNLSLNGLSNVTPFHCAAGDSEGTVTLNLNDRHSSHSLIETTPGRKLVGKEVVPMKTIDLLTSQLPRVDMMKIDVEGSEMAVLRGAKRTLERFHPKLVIEVHGFAVSNAEVMAHLEAYGYRAIIEPVKEGFWLIYAT
jgi:FkbM family methyltransferase